MAPDSTDLDVNGIRMRVQQSGAGPALIFLHGWMLDHRMWKHQIRTLSSHFQVIAPDRRGFGKSTGIPDLAREPDDIAALMQTLGLERAALCAASQAGRVALRFALARPGKIRALVLQGSALDGMPEPADDPGFVPFGAYARLVQSGAMEEFHRQWRSHPFMALPGRSSDLRSELEAMLRDSPCLDLRQAGAATRHLG